MSQTPILGPNGAPIAYFNTVSNGSKFVRHKDGTPLGCYDAVADVTRDKDSHIVARGDQIGILIGLRG